MLLVDAVVRYDPATVRRADGRSAPPLGIIKLTANASSDRGDGLRRRDRQLSGGK